MPQDPHALLATAEKELSRAKGGWSIFGGRQEKYENAAAAFELAANAFSSPNTNMKMEAGKAFERVAEIHRNNLDSELDAASFNLLASDNYTEVDPAAAVRCRLAALDIFEANGKKDRAAKCEAYIGDVYAGPLNDAKSATKHYQAAAKWYKAANSPIQSNKELLKAADLAAISAFTYEMIPLEDNKWEAKVQNVDNDAIKTAFEIYEQVAKSSLSNTALKYSVKEYLLKGGLCRIADDTTGAELIINRYLEIDPSFANQIEYTLLVGLARALCERDKVMFTQYVIGYRGAVDQWKTKMFDMLKGMFDDEEHNEFE